MLEKTYSPSGFVICELETLVPSLRSVMLTPGAAAPEGSMTRPRMVPSVDWARARLERRTRHKAARKNTRVTRLSRQLVIAAKFPFFLLSHLFVQTADATAEGTIQRSDVFVARGSQIGAREYGYRASASREERGGFDHDRVDNDGSGNGRGRTDGLIEIFETQHGVAFGDTSVDCEIDNFKETAAGGMARHGAGRLLQIGDGDGAKAASFHFERHVDGHGVAAGIRDENSDIVGCDALSFDEG